MNRRLTREGVAELKGFVCLRTSGPVRHKRVCHPESKDCYGGGTSLEPQVARAPRPGTAVARAGRGWFVPLV